MKIECCICLEDLATGDFKIKTPKCGHLFHDNCINHWLKNRPSCPQCRATVNQADLHFVHLASTISASRRSSIFNSSVCKDYEAKVEQLIEENRKLTAENQKLKKESVGDRIHKLMLENELLKGEISGRSKNETQVQQLRRQQSSDYKESIVAKAWKKH